MNLTKTRNTAKYLAIKELSGEHKEYSISALCEFAGIARAAYYKWSNHVNSDNDNLNERIAEIVTKIHDEGANPGRAEQWLRLAGCKEIFFVDSKTGEGVAEILLHLKESGDVMPWEIKNTI